MLKQNIVGLLFCLITSVSFSQQIIRGPYLQKASHNRITIKWRTDQPARSQVNYGTDLTNRSLVATDLTLKTDHEIELLGLAPNTIYYYEISDMKEVLASANDSWYFKTHPMIGTPASAKFWILGDCGTANNNQRAVRDAYYQHIGDTHTDGILFLGDNAYNSGRDSEYQRAVFENMYEEKLKNTIAWSCLGNHDGYTANSNAQTGPYYDIFSFPTNGESGGTPSGTEAYYSFDYGNIHFISLESYETDRSVGGAMYRWLENDLQNTMQEWIVAFWHHPAYSKGSHDSDTEDPLIEMRQNFVPMLEEYGVDLVLSGHSHSYERSYFLNGHYGRAATFNKDIHTVGANGDGSGKADGDGIYQKTTNGENGKKGAVYITAGSSGKKSGGSLDHPAMFYSVSELGSCLLEVDGTTLHLKFIEETGAVTDYFSIEKSSFDCTPGAPCNDGDASTLGDKYDQDCKCIGGDIEDSNCVRIASGNDDVEEKQSTGRISRTSSDLELVEDNGSQIVGMRFQNASLPSSSTVSDAYIQFTTDEKSEGAVALEIKGEASANAAPFTTSTKNLSNRTLTNASVNWQPDEWLIVGESNSKQRTPDVALILNEIISQPGFNEQGAIAFQITGSGERVAESYNGSPAKAPILCFNYAYPLCEDVGKACDDGDPCTTNDQYDNHCNCVGIFQDADFDNICDANDLCAGLEPGAPCSDGDPCTFNDVIDNNCQCVGTYVDDDGDTFCNGVDICPGFNNNLIGTACDDGDPCTEGDVYTLDCNCVGTYKDTDNDGTCDAFDLCLGPEPGTPCNDNNDCTVGEKIDANCDCTGRAFVCESRAYAMIALEGFMSDQSTTMHTTLQEINILPKDQPFNKAPWNYTGNESTDFIPANAVDWILVMSRDVSGTVLDQKAGFINKEGQVMDVNGNIGLPLANILGNYLSVHPPAHLAILSATTFTGQIMDFTTNSTSVQGNDQLKSVAGKYALIAGDYDASGVINSKDFNEWKTNGAALNQYLPIDGDGNGIVNSLDYNLWVKNRSKVGHPLLRN